MIAYFYVFINQPSLYNGTGQSSTENLELLQLLLSNLHLRVAKSLLTKLLLQ